MKPNFKEILGDSLRITSEIAAEAVGNNPKYFKEVVSLSLHETTPLNWRAARVVLFCIEDYPKLFIPYVNEIAKLFPTFKVDGLKRAYGHILSKYTKLIEEDYLSEIIEVCFNYMLSEEKIAVKYNCMKLLFEISKIYPDLKGELKASIDFNVSEGIFIMNGEIKKIYREIDILSI